MRRVKMDEVMMDKGEVMMYEERVKMDEERE